MTITETVRAGPLVAEVSCEGGKRTRVDFHGALEPYEYTYRSYPAHKTMDGQDAVDFLRSFSRDLAVAVARVQLAADAADVSK